MSVGLWIPGPLRVPGKWGGDMLDALIACDVVFEALPSAKGLGIVVRY